MSKLSERELVIVDKYIQYLLYKTVQFITQSRTGAKIHTVSKPANTEWFNLTLVDTPEVSDNAKATYGNDASKCLQQTASIEVSLKTAENETMLLEYWWLSRRPDLTTVSMSDIKSPSTVYSYCEKLLKSLVTLSRTTPAYRLSRRQAPQDFTVQCKLFNGEPRLSPSDDFKTQQVATVPSPRGGSVVLTLAYRPNPYLSARRVSSVKNVAIFNDHFDITPTSPPSHHCFPSTSSSIASNTRSTTSTTEHPPLPFDGDLKTGQLENPTKPKRPAFACESPSDAVAVDDEIPFASLLNMMPPLVDLPNDNNKAGEEIGKKLEEKPENCSDHFISELNDDKSHADPDDFVLLGLRYPFAEQEENLGRFYLDCHAAPPMFEGQEVATDVCDSLASASVLKSTVKFSITEQLAQFEANADEFTDFINSLQGTDD